MLFLYSGFGPQHSKAFANSISSTVVSADEVLPHINRLSGRIIVNDVVVKEPKVDRWQFSLGQVRRLLSPIRSSDRIVMIWLLCRRS